VRLLTLMVFSLWSNIAIATPPGQFTFLGQNECAPFEGVLFDPAATATILAERSFVVGQCENKMQHALDTQIAEHTLEIQNLQIRHDALINEYDMRVQSLERESDALANALRKQSRRNPILWVAAGVVGGMAITYGSYRVFNNE